jgi:hypothetical protein
LAQTRRWVGVGSGYATKREYKMGEGKEIAVIRKSVWRLICL